MSCHQHAIHVPKSLNAMLTAVVTALLALACCWGAQARLGLGRQGLIRPAGMQTRCGVQGAHRQAFSAGALPSAVCCNRDCSHGHTLCSSQMHLRVPCLSHAGWEGAREEMTLKASHEAASQVAWRMVPRGAYSSCQTRRAGQWAAISCQELLLQRLPLLQQAACGRQA